MFRSSDSLYPRLTAGDAQFRLPPLQGYGGSSGSRHHSSHARSRSRKQAQASSPPSRYHRAESPDSPGSRTPSPRLSPPHGQTILPSLRDLDFGRSADSDERYLARGVSRIGLGNSSTSSPSSSPAPTPQSISAEERRQHAELIRDLLVAINRDFKDKYGEPTKAGPAATAGHSHSSAAARVRSPLAGPGVTGDDEDRERARTPVQRDVEMINA